MKALTKLFTASCLTVILVLPMVSCSDTDKPAGKKAEVVEPSALLSYVPADTPYVFTNSKPFPRELTEKLLRNAAIELAGAKDEIQFSMGQVGKMDAEKKALTQLMQAILAELDGKMSPEGMASLGLPLSGKSLVYGLGVLPVIRTEIVDPQKVRDFVARVEQRSGMKAPELMHGEQAYWRFDLEELAGIMAVTDDYLIAALIPATAEQALLPEVLGEQKPEKSLADTPAFEQMLADNGFAGYGDGYIDFLRLAEISLGEAQGLNAQIWAALEVEQSDVPPACSNLVKSIVGAVPRMVMGFTEASAQRYALRGVLEVSPEVSAHLRNIAAPVPGLGTPSQAMVTFGMGFNLPAVRDGLKAAMHNIQQQGKGCEWIDEAEMAEAMRGIDMLFNPMVAGIKGFYIVINDMVIDADTMEPQDVDGQILLAVDDPRGIYSMLGMIDAKFTQLQIPADGTPVALPLESVAPDAPTTYVAIKDKSLAFSAGSTATEKMAGILGGTLVSPTPILGLAYHAGRLASRTEVLAEALIRNAEQEGDPEGVEAIRSGYDSFRNSGMMYNQVSVQMTGSSKGLVMDQLVELK